MRWSGRGGEDSVVSKGWSSEAVRWLMHLRGNVKKCDSEMNQDCEIAKTKYLGDIHSF